ncbi:MAG: ankyrin repeat domain-containing protein, partial [Burkholderiales bacterium]
MVVDVTERDDNGATALHYLALIPMPSEYNIFGAIISLAEVLGNRSGNSYSSRTRTERENKRENIKQIARRLLDKGVSINARDNQGNTPLHWAVRQKNFPFANYLIELGADINIRGNNGKSLLHEAAQTGDLELIEWLIARNIDVNIQDNDNSNCLVFAASWGKIDVIKPLIEAGVQINHVDNQGYTPLVWAVKNRHKNTAEELIKYGANKWFKDRYGKNLLHHAVDNNCYSIFRLILNIWNKDQILSDLIIWLKEQGLNINEKDNDGLTPFNYAIEKGNFNLADTLINLGAGWRTCDHQGNTCLHRAVDTYNPKIETIKWLINRGLNINEKNQEGLTPLMLAFKRDDMNLARTLINLGADINEQNNSGESALLQAIKSGNPQLVRQLIELGANK